MDGEVPRLRSPDFLWRLVALMTSTRLSEKKQSIYARARDREAKQQVPPLQS